MRRQSCARSSFVGCPIPPKCIGDLQVRARLIGRLLANMLMAERNGIRRPACAVESTYEEHRLVGRLLSTRHSGTVNAGLGGLGQSDGLPQDDIDVVLLAGKLGESQVPSRSRTAAFGLAPPRDEPGATNNRRSSSSSFSSANLSAAVEKPWKMDQWRDPSFNSRGKKRTA